MAEQAKKSRLAEWGSRKRTRKETAIFLLICLVLLGAVILVLNWAYGGVRDDLEELEETLNARYEEPIEVGVSNVGGRSITTFTVGGVQRPDCDAVDDAYLECDDPQPTPVDD